MSFYEKLLLCIAMITICLGLTACDPPDDSGEPDDPQKTDDPHKTDTTDTPCDKNICNCTREGQILYSCYRRSRESILELGSCEKRSGGELEFTYDSLTLCSSCDDGVCLVDEIDKGLNLVVGDVCKPNLFQKRCNPDPNLQNSVLLCNLDEHVVASHCAQRTDTCTMFPATDDLQRTAMGDPGCILGTCTKEGEIKTLNIGTEECRYICTKALDGQLYFRDENLCWGER